MAIPLDYGTGRGVKKDAMGDLIDDETAGSCGLHLVPAGVMCDTRTHAAHEGGLSHAYVFEQDQSTFA